MKVVVQLLMYLVLARYPPERILTTQNLIKITHLTESFKTKLKERNNNVRSRLFGRKNSE